MDFRSSWEHKEYLSERRLERRIQLFHVAILLLLVAFLLNFWFLQMVRGEEYALLAENNRLRRIPLLPTRGVIVDRQDRVLASTRPCLELVLRRDGSHDLAPQLRRLAPILGVSLADLEDRLRAMRGRPLFEPLLLREDVRLEALAWIEARREWFPSVEVRELARRDYPHGPLLAHALGYVGEVSESELAGQPGTEALRSGDVVGKSGLERVYDDRLRGERGFRDVSVNTLGRPLAIGASYAGRPPTDGRRLATHLDLHLQEALGRALGDETGAGVFLDPRTGDVLAIASSPSFDPNLFAGGISFDAWESIRRDPERPMLDRAIHSFYAPGSIFKVVMAVAGLETGTVAPSDTVHCTGAVRIHGQRRLCWKRGGHGTVNLRRALARSCNIYFYRLGQKLGIEPIRQYAEWFGLGRPTGIDVPGESPGILPSPQWKRETLREPWYPGDTISVAIGQGYLAVTPLQMAVKIAAAATGRVPRPVLGTRREEPGEPIPVSDATWEIVRSALRDAVIEGTARSAAIPGVAVAGKTGTAQIHSISAGIHSDKLPRAQRDHGWFVGYAPAADPQVAFAVVVEHGGHGGSSAAPIARRVLQAFFAEPPPKRQTGAARAALPREFRHGGPAAHR